MALGAARRRRARRLSGRRLRGAGRGRCPIPTGSPASRSARSIRRSLPAMRRRARGEAARVLGRDHRDAGLGPRSAIRDARFARGNDARGVQPAERLGGDGARRQRAFSAAHARTLAAAARRSRRRAITTPASQARRSSAWSISTASMPARCAFPSARSMCARGNFVYFDTTTHRSARARDGERLAAAGLSRHRDRRRVLLGRRPRFQHAAAMGAAIRAAPRHARLPGRSVERRGDFRATCPKCDAAEGDPLFQPHPCSDRPLQVHSAAAPRGRRCSRSCPTT